MICDIVIIEINYKVKRNKKNVERKKKRKRKINASYRKYESTYLNIN